MEIIVEIKEIIDKLDKIDEYNSSLADNQRILDGKEQDLLHYIENNKINVFWCYRMIKELKTVREKRRKIKNDMELLFKFNEQKNKLISKENRQFLMNEMFRKEKTLGKKYTNKQYTEEEMQNIIKGV